MSEGECMGRETKRCAGARVSMTARIIGASALYPPPRHTTTPVIPAVAVDGFSVAVQVADGRVHAHVAPRAQTQPERAHVLVAQHLRASTAPRYQCDWQALWPIWPTFLRNDTTRRSSSITCDISGTVLASVHPHDKRQREQTNT